jgi:hypothetical protein
MAGFVIFLSLQYYDRLAALASPGVARTLLGALWLLLLAPVIATVAMPLKARQRRWEEVGRVR